MQAKALDLKSLEDLQRAIQHAKHQEFSFTLVRTPVLTQQPRQALFLRQHTIYTSCGK